MDFCLLRSKFSAVFCMITHAAMPHVSEHPQREHGPGVLSCQPCDEIRPVTLVDSNSSPLTDASATRSSAPDAFRDSRHGWRG